MQAIELRERIMQKIGKEIEEKMIVNLFRISLVKQGIIAPTPATTRGKCRACMMNKKCEYSYSKK